VDFAGKIRVFGTLTGDVTDRVRSADPTLQGLLEQAGVGPDDPVVYDGGAAAMPRWKVHGRLVVGERTWLPNPVQLLEEPVSPERRKVYLRRFMARSARGGFFIQGKGPNEGQTEDRAPDWYALIAESHVPVRVYENALWKITRYEPKRAAS
jgi:hypothetical protein